VSTADIDNEVAPDGSPVILYTRLPPGDEPEIIDAAIPPRSRILELGAGAGRITHALLERGHQVVAVDQSEPMLRHIRGAERVEADIETLDLARRFPVVLLASHFVNVPEEASRRALLRTCRRHVSDDGMVLLERHEPDWAAWASDGMREVAGVRLGLRDVRRDPPYVSAVAVYEIDGRVFEQPFTARVLSDDELATELESVGLRLDRILNPKWVIARRELR
jgi:SAM-dependent methyltransferase